MDQSAWGLRVALIAIGAVIVAGVYLVGVIRRRRRARRYARRAAAWSSLRYGEEGLDSRDNERDPTDDEVIAVRVRKVEPIAELPVVKNEAAALAPPAVAATETITVDDDVPRPARAGRSRRGRKREDQLSFGFDGEAVAVETLPSTPSSPSEPEMLTLYLRPQYGPAFIGSSIVRNANAVGMRHGERNIFHHYGAGDLRTESPLFSLADMYEPGYFDLQRIEAFQTRGLVMFLKLPTALDGPVAFELFLNTAQRLAEGLQGELMSNPDSPLDSYAIDRLRRTAARFANER
jgi:cell division protein ZipA